MNAADMTDRQVREYAVKLEAERDDLRKCLLRSEEKYTETVLRSLASEQCGHTSNFQIGDEHGHLTCTLLVELGMVGVGIACEDRDRLKLSDRRLRKALERAFPFVADANLAGGRAPLGETLIRRSASLWRP